MFVRRFSLVQFFPLESMNCLDKSCYKVVSLHLCHTFVFWVQYCGACSNKGYCNHEKLLKVQEDELSVSYLIFYLGDLKWRIFLLSFVDLYALMLYWYVKHKQISFTVAMPSSIKILYISSFTELHKCPAET